jgi:16S rRNA processing protein RimM
MALVGWIARPHGLRGEVLVNPETDFVEERFQPGAVLFISRAGSLDAIRIDASRVHLGRPLVKIAGVETLSEAEGLAGLELRVPIAELHDLPPGHYYEHELRGCRVQLVEGRTVGVVDRVERASGTSCLVAVTDAGAEILVPLAEEICVAVDLSARLILVRPPEGLLALNEPERRRRRS